jgi:hypothetical protein
LFFQSLESTVRYERKTFRTAKIEADKSRGAKFADIRGVHASGANLPKSKGAPSLLKPGFHALQSVLEDFRRHTRISTRPISAMRRGRIRAYSVPKTKTIKIFILNMSYISGI